MFSNTDVATVDVTGKLTQEDMAAFRQQVAVGRYYFTILNLTDSRFDCVNLTFRIYIFASNATKNILYTRKNYQI